MVFLVGCAQPFLCPYWAPKKANLSGCLHRLNSQNSNNRLPDKVAPKPNHTNSGMPHSTGPKSIKWGASPNAKDRKSTRLNSSHVSISYAVFCLKKKNITTI